MHCFRYLYTTNYDDVNFVKLIITKFKECAMESYDDLFSVHQKTDDDTPENCGVCVHKSAPTWNCVTK